MKPASERSFRDDADVQSSDIQRHCRSGLSPRAECGGPVPCDRCPRTAAHNFSDRSMRSDDGERTQCAAHDRTHLVPRSIRGVSASHVAHMLGSKVTSTAIRNLNLPTMSSLCAWQNAAQRSGLHCPIFISRRMASWFIWLITAFQTTPQSAVQVILQ